MEIRTDHGDFFISEESFEPAYMALYRSGLLQERIVAAVAELSCCHICPRICGANRLNNETAVCKTGRFAYVASFNPHFGEENPIRGRYGSGTIFFSWCNLHCVFCQNYDISHLGAGVEVNASQLAEIMLRLQDLGCHNVNFVTPEHVVPQVLEALILAIERGFRLPLVYNTSAYDSQRSLQLLDGIIDIYMPDFKIWDSNNAKKYLKAEDYPEVARNALREMHRQVGVLKVDRNGIARRGLLVRHLVMPDGLAGSAEIMHFLAEELSSDTYVNIMDQYYPAGKVGGQKYNEINRRISAKEYETAVQSARIFGLWRFDKR